MRPVHDRSLATGGAWIRGLVNFVLPPACAICRVPHDPTGHPDGIVCGACLARIEPLIHPLCVRCGHPRLSMGMPLPSGVSATGAPDELPPCRWCARLPDFVRAARSVCRMDVGGGSALVHALKYDGWSGVAEPMARRMARLSFPEDVVRERTAVVPIPLSPTRLRERGYNQAERLASSLARQWKLPMWGEVIRRTRHTQSQVELTPSERTGNVSQAFQTAVSDRTRLRGSHIVLVDDVITTAATLNAAAAALMDGGTRIISYITFGRAPEPGDRTVPDIDSDQD